MTTPTDITFSASTTVISSAWCNGVNDWVYGWYGVMGETFTAASARTAFGLVIGTNVMAQVAPSTAGNLLTSDGAGNWTSAAASHGIGVGQTWQDMSGSRVSGTIYRNTTGKPIYVHVSGATNESLVVLIGSTTPPTVYLANCPTLSKFTDISFIVPNNDYYQVTMSIGGFNVWAELR